MQDAATLKDYRKELREALEEIEVEAVRETFAAHLDGWLGAREGEKAA